MVSGYVLTSLSNCLLGEDAAVAGLSALDVGVRHVGSMVVDVGRQELQPGLEYIRVSASKL